MFESSSIISMSGGRNLGGASAAIQLESLQATLKQQQGTIIQHQMDVAGLERTKEGKDGYSGNCHPPPPLFPKLAFEIDRFLRLLYFKSFRINPRACTNDTAGRFG